MLRELFLTKGSFRLSVARIACKFVPIVVQYRIGSRLYSLKCGIQDDLSITTRTRSGAFFTGRTSDLYGYYISVYGFFEWAFWAIARALCSEGDTIVEIGANVGSETVGYARVAGKKGKVFAFEPYEQVRRELQTNVQLNQFTNVTILPVALGDRDGTMTFVAPPANRHNSGVGYVTTEWAESNSSETPQVTCMKLDSISDRIGNARVIFMDVEGSEVRVLRGARQFINANRPAIVLEANPPALERAGYSLFDLIEELNTQNYTPYIIGHWRLSPVVPKGRKQTDWLCIPNEQSEIFGKVKKILLQGYFMPFLLKLNPLQRL